MASVYQVVVRRLEDHLPVDFGCVCLYDPATETLTVTRVGVRSEALAMELAMKEQVRIPIDQNGLSRCVRGHLVYEPDLRRVDFPFPQRLSHGGLRAVVFAPLQVESHVFGVLIAARRDRKASAAANANSSASSANMSPWPPIRPNSTPPCSAPMTTCARPSKPSCNRSGCAPSARWPAASRTTSTTPFPRWPFTPSRCSKPSQTSARRARDYLETIQHSIEDVAQTVARMREFYRQREPQLTLCRWI